MINLIFVLSLYLFSIYSKEISNNLSNSRRTTEEIDQNQHSHWTLFNRHPDIFQYTLDATKIYQPNVPVKKILSFGCSYGMEVKALSELYFTKDFVDGVEYAKDIVETLVKENTTERNHFYNKMVELVPQSYDVVFAMSVLLQWPENEFPQPYPFHKFNHTLQIINRYVKVNGFIIIYNAKYRFTDLNLYTKGCYTTMENNKSIPNKFPELTQWDQSGKPVKDYPYFGFRKIKAC